MKELISEHYDHKYFSWQRAIGEFGGWADLPIFEPYVKPYFNVIDFGCGGGYLLKNLQCKGRIGIEVNEIARREVERQGITVCESADEIEDDWADLVISHYALEHCLHPLQEIKKLYPKVKPGGRAVFAVPCESIDYAYVPNDINHHLYSWSPMCIGNLFTEAGFVVETSKPYVHKWPPHYREIAILGGRHIFELACRIYGQIERSWFQVILVAHR